MKILTWILIIIKAFYLKFTFQKIRLYVDDERAAPKKFNLQVFTSRQALFVVNNFLGNLVEISLDHDLGGSDDTRVVAKHLENLAYFNKIKNLQWHVHTANPSGRQYLEAAMRKVTEYMEKNNHNGIDF